MDDIQFWIYLVFAAIYFIGKALKKKNKPPVNRPRPQSPLETETELADRPQTSRPATFEELLEEITGQKSLEPETPVEESVEEKPVPFYEEQKEIIPVQKDESIEMEGRNRQFADEESKRIYEESIKRAEGFNIGFEPDEKFSSKKVLRSTAEEETENEFASEIKSMLQNPDDAKKAIILSEILNRKY
ncbi:MAG: hypothetical protein JXQ90_01485 [Cyclobacteriaceae bacterium]